VGNKGGTAKKTERRVNGGDTVKWGKEGARKKRPWRNLYRWRRGTW